jgi:hypothetical protein
LVLFLASRFCQVFGSREPWASTSPHLLRGLEPSSSRSPSPLPLRGRTCGTTQAIMFLPPRCKGEVDESAARHPEEHHMTRRVNRIGFGNPFYHTVRHLH